MSQPQPKPERGHRPFPLIPTLSVWHFPWKVTECSPDAEASMGAVGSVTRTGVDHRRNRLDLQELVVVPQHGDAEQRTRHVVLAERLTNDLLRRHEVGLARGGHQNARTDDIRQTRDRLAKCDPHVLDALRCLGCVVPDTGGRAVEVQRAGR